MTSRHQIYDAIMLFTIISFFFLPFAPLFKVSSKFNSFIIKIVQLPMGRRKREKKSYKGNDWLPFPTSQTWLNPGKRRGDDICGFVSLFFFCGSLENHTGYHSHGTTISSEIAKTQQDFFVRLWRRMVQPPLASTTWVSNTIISPRKNGRKTHFPPKKMHIYAERGFVIRLNSPSDLLLFFFLLQRPVMFHLHPFTLALFTILSMFFFPTYRAS